MTEMAKCNLTRQRKVKLEEEIKLCWSKDPEDAKNDGGDCAGTGGDEASILGIYNVH
jgi:hypothetical protein